jgi:hypothetical protein
MKNRKLLMQASLDCKEENQCDNMLCRGYWVGLHQITQAEYASMVDAFFMGNPPPPKEYASNDIDTTVPCNFIVEFDAPDSTPDQRATNTDIAISVVVPHIGNYSIGLFKGIKDIFSPEKFFFSKAIGPSGITTAAFFATDGANNPLYFGDLSGLFP